MAEISARELKASVWMFSKKAYVVLLLAQFFFFFLKVHGRGCRGILSLLNE